MSSQFSFEAMDLAMASPQMMGDGLAWGRRAGPAAFSLLAGHNSIERNASPKRRV